jgi:ABC-type glycerol-3-phosphate transport system substrate-binding protein
LFLIPGCSSIPPFPLLTTPTLVPIIQATSTPDIFETETPLPPPEARILRVWLPPRFNPDAGTESANLLKQRFGEFESRHPGLEIELRIKAEDGETGLLNSLFITNNAAPAALPDLVALPRPFMEDAALNGILHPIDGLSTALHDPDWYGYARDLGHIQNIGYGLPFAGDAMTLVYDSDVVNAQSWESIFSAKNSLAFAAADPQGLFGLCLYVSAGGKIQDSSGLPILEQDALVRVLTWVQDGVAAESLLPSLKNVSSQETVIKGYEAGNVDMAVTWYTTLPVDGAFTPIPGLGGFNYGFASGWVWALAGSNPENQQIAIELAEYLTADDFIGTWTEEAGYLPTRPSSVAIRDSAVASIAESSYLVPPDDVLLIIGPLVQEAVVRVLNGEQPEIVAGSVIEKLK